MLRRDTVGQERVREAPRHELFISRLEWFEMSSVSVSDDFYCLEDMCDRWGAQLHGLRQLRRHRLPAAALVSRQERADVVLQGYNGWINRQYLLISVLVYSWQT